MPTPVTPTITPGIYRHFKGNTYHILKVIQHTETGELSVLYVPQYGEFKGRYAYRPLEMFTEEVDRPELNYKGPRFALVEEKRLSEFNLETGSFP